MRAAWCGDEDGGCGVLGGGWEEGRRGGADWWDCCRGILVVR